MSPHTQDLSASGGAGQQVLRHPKSVPALHLFLTKQLKIPRFCHNKSIAGKVV